MCSHLLYCGQYDYNCNLKSWVEEMKVWVSLRLGISWFGCLGAVIITVKIEMVDNDSSKAATNDQVYDSIIMCDQLTLCCKEGCG